MTPLPIGARVLIDCDGGAVPCEVVAHDALRGLERMRMILPGQKRDGLCFWRPADTPALDADAAPSAADPIQPTGREDGDSPARGNGSAAEAAGSHGHPSPDLVCASGSRAGVAVVGRPSGRALIAVAAALGVALLARDARRLCRARGVVRAYRSGRCPL